MPCSGKHYLSQPQQLPKRGSWLGGEHAQKDHCWNETKVYNWLQGERRGSGGGGSRHDQTVRSVMMEVSTHCEIGKNETQGVRYVRIRFTGVKLTGDPQIKLGAGDLQIKLSAWLRKMGKSVLSRVLLISIPQQVSVMFHISTSAWQFVMKWPCVVKDVSVFDCEGCVLSIEMLLHETMYQIKQRV